MNPLPKMRLIVALDPQELAVRILEASMGRSRPEGATAAQALMAMDEDNREDALRGAMAAMQYFVEQSSDAQVQPLEAEKLN